jgi:hypothetical protein
MPAKTPSTLFLAPGRSGGVGLEARPLFLTTLPRDKGIAFFIAGSPSPLVTVYSLLWMVPEHRAIFCLQMHLSRI